MRNTLFRMKRLGHITQSCIGLLFLEMGMQVHVRMCMWVIVHMSVSNLGSILCSQKQPTYEH